jgi:hypothetical protein
MYPVVIIGLIKYGYQVGVLRLELTSRLLRSVALKDTR